MTLTSDWFSEAKRIIFAVWSWSELNSASCLLCQPWLLPEKGWLSHPCPPPSPPHGGWYTRADSPIPSSKVTFKTKNFGYIRLMTPVSVLRKELAFWESGRESSVMPGRRPDQGAPGNIGDNRHIPDSCLFWMLLVSETELGKQNCRM